MQECKKYFRIIISFGFVIQSFYINHKQIYDINMLEIKEITIDENLFNFIRMSMCFSLSTTLPFSFWCAGVFGLNGQNHTYTWIHRMTRKSRSDSYHVHSLFEWYICSMVAKKKKKINNLTACVFFQRKKKKINVQKKSLHTKTSNNDNQEKQFNTMILLIMMLMLSMLNMTIIIIEIIGFFLFFRYCCRMVGISEKLLFKIWFLKKILINWNRMIKDKCDWDMSLPQTKTYWDKCEFFSYQQKKTAILNVRVQFVNDHIMSH